MTDTQLADETRKEIARCREFEKTAICKGYQVSYLREVSERHFDKTRWKNAFKTDCPLADVGALLMAIEFFHGATGQIGGTTAAGCIITVRIASPGYQAD
jgi:hypothetical protein